MSPGTVALRKGFERYPARSEALKSEKRSNERGKTKRTRWPAPVPTDPDLLTPNAARSPRGPANLAHRNPTRDARKEAPRRGRIRLGRGKPPALGRTPLVPKVPIRRGRHPRGPENQALRGLIRHVPTEAIRRGPHQRDSRKQARRNDTPQVPRQRKPVCPAESNPQIQPSKNRALPSGCTRFWLRPAWGPVARARCSSSKAG